MKVIDQKKNRITKALAVLGVLMMALGFVITTEAASRSYEVSFRAGSQGSVAGESSYGEKVEYNQNLPHDSSYYDGLVEPDSGYYFTGWSEEIETKVTGKAVYVAQYAKIIEGAAYRISYQDNNGMSLETHKAGVTEEGAVITANAPLIEGYEPDADTKSVTAKGEETEITFIYSPVQGQEKFGKVTRNGSENIQSPKDSKSNMNKQNQKIFSKASVENSRQIWSISEKLFDFMWALGFE